MPYIVDLIIVLILALFTFIGYKQGLIKVAIKIFSFLIAIIVALVVYKPVSNLIIDRTSIDDNIENTIVSKILPQGEESVDENTEVKLEGQISNIIATNSRNTVKSIAQTFTVKIIETSVLLILFVVVKIALKFVTALTDLIAKIPIIKQFNKAGGTIYGLLKGAIIILVGFAVISLISPVIDAQIINNINKSIIGSVIYNNNILLNFII